jgi:hypothetical protein
MAGRDPATQTLPQMQILIHRLKGGGGEWGGDFNPNIVLCEPNVIYEKPICIRGYQTRNDAFYALQNLSCPFDRMRFYLVYRGPLRALGASGKNKKHDRIEVRKQIAPQLKMLWEVSPALIRLRHNARVPGSDHHVLDVGDSPLYEHYKTPPQYPLPDGFVDLSRPIKRHGRQYLPLVRESLSTTCTLNVLFLRQEEPGSLRQGDGDLDNRIKTFLDALEIKPEDGNSDGDEVDGINYRLFENDKLVRGLKIDSERLLFPDADFPSNVHLIVEVVVHVESVGPWNVSLLG